MSCAQAKLFTYQYLITLNYESRVKQPTLCPTMPPYIPYIARFSGKSLRSLIHQRQNQNRGEKEEEEEEEEEDKEKEKEKERERQIIEVIP